MSIPRISTGDIFRHNVTNHTELGALAKEYMDRGDLVPDEITVAMVRDRLAEKDAKDGFLLDGFPRNVPQAETLKKLLAEMDVRLTVVLDLEVDEEEVVRRLGLPKKKLNIIKKALRIHNGGPQGVQEEAGSSIDDMLPDGRDKGPDAALAAADERREVLGLLGELDERRATVLRLHFGLDGEGPLTLREIGDVLGVTESRVSQLHTKAILRLRSRLAGVQARPLAAD